MSDIEQSEIELSVVMPCLNEAETLAVCIRKARSFLHDRGVVGEVVVADNGSTDGSPAIATQEGARVVHVPVRGYGAALQAGISGAHGRFVIMGDADDSYDFSRLEAFVEALRDGHDLVMGNRFRGGIAPGAMPFLHRYLGNPVLTTIGRLFFDSPARDFHCGLRGFGREAILSLDLRTTGMEYASEMVVKASLGDLRVTEVPTTLSRDGRSRPPHLRTWRDGWRHLRFLLLYSPRFLFLYPGAALLLVSAAVFAWLLPGPVVFRGFGLDVHTLLFASAGIQLGLLSMYFWWFARTFTTSVGLLPVSARVSGLQRLLTLERGLIVGGAVFSVGLWLAVEAVFSWKAKNFGELDYQVTLRVVIPAVTALVSGTLIALGSFLVSLLTLGRR